MGKEKDLYLSATLFESRIIERWADQMTGTQVLKKTQEKEGYI